MSIRVSGAFVTKFNEAMRLLEDASPLEIQSEVLCADCDRVWEQGEDKCPVCDCQRSYINTFRPSTPRKQAIEDFIDRMKYDLAAVLLADGAGVGRMDLHSREK